MRRILGVGLAVMVLGLAVGCGKKDSTSGSSGPGGAPSLEGNYTMIGMEVMGTALPEDLISKMPEAEKVFKVTADKMIMTKNGKEDPATYKIDASKTPNEIDLTGKTKGGKDEKMYGIYKLEGDKLTLCLVETDKPADRPKEFKTTADGKSMIMIFKKK